MSKLNETSVQYVKGVGPVKKKLFSNLGIESVEDLLYYFPRHYQDRRELTPLAQVKIGEYQTITGLVLSCKSRRSYYTKKHVTEVVLDDKSGRIFLTWFNQPYLEHYFKKDAQVVCYGKVDMYKSRIQMVSCEYEVIEGDDDSLSLKCIVPIYPLTRGITQRYLRKTISLCIEKFRDDLVDELPANVRKKYKLSNINSSIDNIHFPKDFDQQEEALRRISFEEFYFFQISIILRRLSIKFKKGISQKISDNEALEFINSFEFELTSAQRRAIADMRADMGGNGPMHRLLQGDVGSGKTLVAVFGCFLSFKAGHQSCVMAPTEILARQHYENIQNMVDRGTLKGMRVELLVSAMKKNEKEEIYRKIGGGEVDLVIGTHALISEDVNFKDLGFVVIDEQHKFGVRQRALLTDKGGNPDVLIMTATPIPRTLCITLYGDLDISIIDEMPKSRGKVKTIHYNEDHLEHVYDIVRKKVTEGSQAYFVYPIIEESETLDLKAAEDMFKLFTKKVFKNFKVGLLHGQMNRNETQEIMTSFIGREIDILVATTVLEVGVDVKTANVMVIEHADRFGLAQLHQLRGRVGRGKDDALCLLVCDPRTDEGKERIKAILSTSDGFKIAQHDLEIRGPGRFFGRHQHGLNELKVANPATQLDILEMARKEAIALTVDDPKLEKDDNLVIKKIIKRRYPTYLMDVKAG
ncbi:MAG: ATP-dependent DNA helicase RecG [Candidatus Omnitrophica bacterium]|nr:ATP-dependent DNA helicase RecG [Candidatus Omnitrophota bacterium]MBU1996682.1 ATP-dependent DNA helicase RecG [Candidatus Omnitrophota bacterium]